MRRFTRLTEGTKQSFTTSDKAKVSVTDELIKEYEPSVFHDIVCFHGTMGTEKDDFHFDLKNTNLKLLSHEITTAINEVNDFIQRFSEINKR